MKDVYKIDIMTGDCSTISKNSVVTESSKVPEDVVLKLNTKAYAELISDNLSSTIRVREIKNKKPLWYSRLKKLAMSKKAETDDGICVQISIRDEGTGCLGVYCFIEPNILCECIYEGSSEKFFLGEGIPHGWDWLSSYIYGKLKFYDWLQLSCIDLVFTADVRRGFDERNLRFFKGITTEKGIFGGVNDEYCSEGEYTLAEIVCL
jgi:hypothetical protein